MKKPFLKRGAVRGGERWREAGFSLPEILVASVLVVLIVAGVCQALTLTMTAYAVAQRSWNGTLELWNRSNRYFSGEQLPVTTFRPFPESHLLEKQVIGPLPGENSAQWEVLRAR